MRWRDTVQKLKRSVSSNALKRTLSLDLWKGTILMQCDHWFLVLALGHVEQCVPELQRMLKEGKLSRDYCHSYSLVIEQWTNLWDLFQILMKSMVSVYCLTWLPHLRRISLILTFEGCKRPGFGGKTNLPAELRGGGSSSNAALANKLAVLFHKWLGELLWKDPNTLIRWKFLRQHINFGSSSG